MTGESALLEAIRCHRHDDAARLVYADWLEEQGDPRSEYPRLQVELKRTWSYEDQRPDLLARMAELRTQLDPQWLALARRCTTPPPPVDVARAIPELAGKAKITVRLHPRRGEAPRDASKIGGLFLWPEEEEWPVCPEHDCPFVPVLQLRKEDVPEIGFRRGTDLLQIMWCPHNHEPNYYCPAPETYWWKRSQIKNPVESHPVSVGEWEYVPNPCLFHFERVTEYPDSFELTSELDDKINSSEQLHHALDLVSRHPIEGQEPPGEVTRLYQCWLSTADGTKVGGYPDWIQDSAYPECSCGERIRLLLAMFASTEFDAATRGRWLPIEERDVLTADYQTCEAVASAPGWMFGDAGNLNVFCCQACKSRPIRWDMQCS